MKVESIRFPAILCALTLPLAALAIRPVVEMGLCDDWSYIKTVQVLAQTGHVVYNGWATAMLGWQLYLGAIFVKLFGFSFTTVRASILPVAMVTAFLTQRTMVRAGISEWNASLGTLVLVVSPLFLPLTFSFMTDITGLFCIVLCLYACLRALQAETDRAALAWICFAAVSNAIGGTARQIVWLGVLVMVPSTLWLLRHRPRFLLYGSLLYLVCIAFIFASIHWFHQQPYSVPETLIRDRITLRTVPLLLRNLLRGSLDTSLLLLPILLIFIPALRRGNRRSTMLFVAGGSLFILFCLVELHRHVLDLWLAPYLGNYVTIYGLMEDAAIHGRHILLTPGIRRLVTSLIAVSLIALFALLLARLKKIPSTSAPAPLSWQQLGAVIVPFTMAYIILLMPRAASRAYLFFDRYLLPLQLMALIPSCASIRNDSDFVFQSQPLFQSQSLLHSASLEPTISLRYFARAWLWSMNCAQPAYHLLPSTLAGSMTAGLRLKTLASSTIRIYASRPESTLVLPVQQATSADLFSSTTSRHSRLATALLMTRRSAKDQPNSLLSLFEHGLVPATPRSTSST